MVGDFIKEAEAVKRVDELAQQDDRLKTLQVLAKTKGWGAKKTAGAAEYLRKRLAAMTDSERAYLPESRLVELIEEAGRDYDRYLAKQGFAKLTGNKKPKFR